MPAVPVHDPRRSRGSFSAVTGRSPVEDISHLNIAEVRERIARNERVLNSALLRTPPTNGTGTAMAMSPSSRASGAENPVRARLLAMRAQLCAREAELLADSVGNMDLSTQATPPRTYSAKANALNAIRQAEAAHPLIAWSCKISLIEGANGRSVDDTIALGERDFDNQWMARFANVGIAPSGRRGGRDDALKRSERASRRARANVDGEDCMFDTDEAYSAAGVYASQRQDMGNGLPMATARARRQEGYDDDMRSDGSRDDEWLEGNDEYEVDQRDTLDLLPG